VLTLAAVAAIKKGPRKMRFLLHVEDSDAAAFVASIDKDRFPSAYSMAQLFLQGLGDEVDEKYRVAAQENYGRGGELEFDDDAIVSASEKGAYVLAWRWIAAREAGVQTNDDADG